MLSTYKLLLGEVVNSSSGYTCEKVPCLNSRFGCHFQVTLYFLCSCRREILNNPSKYAMIDAQRAKFAACTHGTHPSKLTSRYLSVVHDL